MRILLEGGEIKLEIEENAMRTQLESRYERPLITRKEKHFLLHSF